MDLESVFYEYLERFRTLLAAETWRRLAMEMSKNDLLSLLYLHRAQQSPIWLNPSTCRSTLRPGLSPGCSAAAWWSANTARTICGLS